MSDIGSSDDEARRNTRGNTEMHELAEIRKRGERVVIQYNADGQEVGWAAPKLQSYLGTLVRKSIPLTCTNWSKDVPNDLKEKIWDCLEMTFVLDPKSKHRIMVSASHKFRSFRYNLTQYIMRYKDRKPHRIASPPPKHNYIAQDQWNYFVKYRLSEEFKKKSKEGKERRALLKYPHRLARKGYARLAVDLKLDDSTDPSYRATLWKEARMDKNKRIVDPATIETVNRMDSLAKEKQGQDVLTEALGTPEHRGRVRGVGGFIPPSKFYKFAHPKSNLGKEPTQPQMCVGSAPCHKSTSVGSNLLMMHGEGVEEAVEAGVEVAVELSAGEDIEEDVEEATVELCVGEDIEEDVEEANVENCVREDVREPACDPSYEDLGEIRIMSDIGSSDDEAQRNTRGNTEMHELAEIRKRGERVVIQYNADGQEVGWAAPKLQSYLGTLVRKSIPLTCTDWSKDVPNDLKEKIWDCLEMTFVLDPQSKHRIMVSASHKFRSFRYNLTQYIMRYKDRKPHRIASPPPKHNYIAQDQWNYFVKDRLSEEFKKKSKEGKERRALLKYPHRLARKGYARLAVDLKLDDSTDPSYRATLWKEARMDKNKRIVDPATIETVNRMDALAKEKQGQDVLTEALGTPEHRGRVRGVGGFVPPSKFYKFAHPKFNLGKEPTQPQMCVGSAPCHKSTSVGSNLSMMHEKGVEEAGGEVACAEELTVELCVGEDIEEDVEEVTVELCVGEDIEEDVKEANVENCVREDVREPTCDPSYEDLGEGMKCQLAIESVDNIVAIGTMYESKGLFTKIHGMLIGKYHVRVMVDLIFEGNSDLDLPMPLNKDLMFLGQAKGTIVPWPRMWVIPSSAA